MMLTKVFLVPPIPAQASKLEPRFAKRYSSTMLFNIEYRANRTMKLGGDASKTAKDSGYVEWESSNSLAAQVSSGMSSARTSVSSSIALTVAESKPERNAVSDSLLANGNHGRSPVNGHARSRKVRLAVALLFLPKDPSIEM